MRLGRLFILMLVARMGVFLARIIRSRRHDGWMGMEEVGSSGLLRGFCLVESKYMYISVGVWMLLLKLDWYGGGCIVIVRIAMTSAMQSDHSCKLYAL